MSQFEGTSDDSLNIEMNRGSDIYKHTSVDRQKCNKEKLKGKYTKYRGNNVFARKYDNMEWSEILWIEIFCTGQQHRN